MTARMASDFQPADFDFGTIDVTPATGSRFADYQPTKHTSARRTMSRFATKTIAAFTFCLAAALSCSGQAGESDQMSDDEYYFLLSIGEIEEKPMPSTEMTEPSKTETQSQTSTSSIQGVSGLDLGSSRIRGLSGTDLGSGRIRNLSGTDLGSGR